jgi:hypothetical protein
MFPFSIVDCVRRIETLFDQPCEVVTVSFHCIAIVQQTATMDSF